MIQKNSFGKNSFDLSSETHHKAKMEELGELRKFYPILKSNTTLFALGVSCIMLGPCSFLFLLPLILIPSIHLYLPTASVLGSILLIIGLYLTLSQRLYQHWHISLWQYGFIYEKKQMIQVFRWNHIESVQRALSPRAHGGEPFYRVRREDGYEIKLGIGFLGIAELIDTVLEESVRHLASQELRVLAPRSISTFPTFKLDKQGIGNTQETLSWEEIQEFVTTNGAVTLCKKNEQP